MSDTTVDAKKMTYTEAVVLELAIVATITFVTAVTLYTTINAVEAIHTARENRRIKKSNAARKH